jgi:hypothetical protein
LSDCVSAVCESGVVDCATNPREAVASAMQITIAISLQTSLRLAKN